MEKIAGYDTTKMAENAFGSHDGWKKKQKKKNTDTVVNMTTNHIRPHPLTE